MDEQKAMDDKKQWMVSDSKSLSLWYSRVNLKKLKYVYSRGYS